MFYTYIFLIYFTFSVTSFLLCLSIIFKLKRLRSDLLSTPMMLKLVGISVLISFFAPFLVVFNALRINNYTTQMSISIMKEFDERNEL